VAGTLGELQEQPRKRKFKSYEPRPCRFCMRNFIPRSGMAAKHRDWCYEPACEIRREGEKKGHKSPKETPP